MGGLNLEKTTTIMDRHKSPFSPRIPTYTTHLNDVNSYPSLKLASRPNRKPNGYKQTDNDIIEAKSPEYNNAGSSHDEDDDAYDDGNTSNFSEQLISNLLQKYTPKDKRVTHNSRIRNNLTRSDSFLRNSFNYNLGSTLNLGLNFNLNPSKESNQATNLKSNTGIGRDYWLDDASAIKCRACDRKFTTFVRKHHCRICGKIFCSNCTTFIDGEKFNHNGKMRVCLLCHKLADRYDDEVFSSDEEDEYLEIDKTDHDHDHHYVDNSRDYEKQKNDKLVDDIINDNMNRLTTPTPPPMMAIPTTRAGEAVEIDIPKNSFYKEAVNNSRSLLTRHPKSADTIENESSDDENEMISFMNNHQFNWPKSSDPVGMNNSYSTRNFKALNGSFNTPNHGNTHTTYGHNNQSLFVPKNSLKMNSHSNIHNALINNSKSLRRRNFSGRYKTRQLSKRYMNPATQLTNRNSSSFSSINTNIQFSDDFQRIGERYAKSLLIELLIDKSISNFAEWSNILMSSMKKISNLEIDLKSINNSTSNNNLDSIYDFANFIKIKKILGSDISHSKSIEGILFSKKLPLSNMPSTIDNPKIMLITFPIEYDQEINSKHHYQSLEPIIAQQDQYIKKLVDRITVLKPNIIVSSNSVNGLALEIFAEMKIAVVPNCKLNNLIKLSKFTDSTIITSIDLLAMKPQIGTCEIFKVVNYKFENSFKTFLLFDGCPNKIGLTIILRNENEEVLTKVKSCLMIMIYTFANIKLESSFMRDQCLKVDDNNETDFLPRTESLTSLYTSDVKNFDDFIDLVNSRLVSTSPWVKFDSPLILKQLISTRKKIQENERTYQEFCAATPEDKPKYKLQFNIDDIEFYTDSDYVKLLNSVKEYRANYRKVEMAFYLRKWEQFWRSRELTYFDPNYNQNIVLLFSMISKKNSTPCIGPEIQFIDFYWENDFSLGQFIENICLNANSLCNASCQLPLKDHYRSYVHNNGKIDIFLEENSLNVSSNTIMTWSVCKRCLNSTPVLPLTDTSYKYSFGKFLQLIFWFNNSFDFKILSNNNTCTCDVNNPKFDFFKDYIHYFSFKSFKVHLEHSVIDNLKLIIPKFQLFMNPVYDYNIKLNHFNDVKSKCLRFFQSVENRLRRIRLDGTNLNSELMEDGNKKLEELKAKLQAQVADIDSLQNTVYENSEINEHLKLNVVLREVQELSSFWNVEFQSFAKIYLPSEKDIKKITAFQLDRLFKNLLTKEESDEEAETTEDSEKVKTAEKDEEASLFETEGNLLNGPNESKQLLPNTGTDQLQAPEDQPKKHRSQLILNRIHELNRKQSDDLLWIPPTNDSEGRLDEGKVKELTKFFDTQEYFNQRELEKKKLDRFNSYTPRVSMMNPKIEIYKSASDAVNAETHKHLLSNNAHSTTTNTNQIPKTKESYHKEEIKCNNLIDTENDKQNADKADNDKEKDVQPEKVSLLKSLTHFWADRSATLWEPLTYPLSSSEHIFIDSDVIIREDEPSSIIAFCLSTSDYELKLKNKNAGTNTNTSVVAETVPEAKTDSHNHGVEEESAALEERNDKDTVTKHEGENVTRNEKLESAIDLESIMLKNGFHLYYEFEEGCSTISCKLFFAQQFDALRRKCGVNDNFVNSLARCKKWDSTGGKSGSTFLKTLDQRFIIKELSKAELEAFSHFAPTYFEYFSQVLFHDLPSVLVKIFGFYQIQVKNNLPGEKSYTLDILIMENLFYDRKIDRIFDLKGSMRNRHVEQTGKENEVLLDENMVEYIYESPLFVKENDKKLLRNSLFNDTLFLEKMNVMDYSLVVGIDHANEELVVGIIDCIRTFTWDKKLESWVKEKGLVGNTGVGKEPTVITPKQYKNRFREAMERYILMSPGVYYQGTTTTT